MGEDPRYDKWVVVDLEGTIADDSHRTHLIPDWDAYHAACEKDDVYEDVAQVVRELSENHPLAIITERNAKYFGETLNWLTNRHIAPDQLFMRPDDNYDSVVDLKMKWITEIGIENIFIVIEDNDKLVEKWRNICLTCLQPRIS